MLLVVGQESPHSFVARRCVVAFRLLCQVILSLVIHDSLYSPALWKRSRAMLAFGCRV